MSGFVVQIGPFDVRWRFAAAVLSLAAMALVAAVVAATAEPAKKPPVPVGVDPGGVLVAIIGDGIDYTRPDIAARLARDGEGELVGWDLVDNDRRPYREKVPEATAVVARLLSDPGKPRIAPFRIGDLAMRTTPNGALKALAMAAQSNARVVLLSLPHDQTAAEIAATLAKLPRIVFVVPTTPDYVGPPNDHIHGRGHGPLDIPDNVLILESISKCRLQYYVYVAHMSPALPPDLSTDGGCVDMPEADARSITVASEKLAAARIAALAARIASTNPTLTGADLKRRILAFAKPFPADEAGRNWAGVYHAAPLLIEDPSVHQSVK